MGSLGTPPSAAVVSRSTMRIRGWNCSVPDGKIPVLWYHWDGVDLRVLEYFICFRLSAVAPLHIKPSYGSISNMGKGGKRVIQQVSCQTPVLEDFGETGYDA